MPKKTKSSPRGKTSRRWSAHVTRTSQAMQLEPAVFQSNSPRKIALSLKRSAEASRRRKSGPYRSAMSMLNFYINRGGKNFSPSKRRALERAKGELRKAFGRNRS